MRYLLIIKKTGDILYEADNKAFVNRQLKKYELSDKYNGTYEDNYYEIIDLKKK